ETTVIERRFELRLLRFKEARQLLRELTADRLEQRVLTRTDHWKARLVVVLGRMRLFPFARFAEKLARKHIADVGMDCRLRQPELPGDARDRPGLSRDDIQYSFLSAVIEELILGDGGPRVAVAMLRRNAFAGELQT